MRPRLSRWLPLVVVALLTAAVYGWRLGAAPIYVSPDEAIIAVDAHALATTGVDVHGRFLPLYFQVQLPGETRMGWFTPAIFYLSAIVDQVLPFSEATIRMPTVIVAIADVVLIYLAAMRLFRARWLAIAAALMLATTPAHFMLGRYGLDYLYPLPFVLGWLVCLLIYLDTDRVRWLAAAAALLGVGFFSYIAAVVMMPLYLLVTWLVVARKPQPLRLWAASAAAFAVPLLPLVPWLMRHPTAVVDTIARYDLYDTKSLNVLQGIRSFFSFPNVERLAASYWTFFSPAFLFFSGDRQVMFSTRTTGVFLLPLIVLLVVGLRYVLIEWKQPRLLILLVGFLTAPLAALLGAEDGAITRAVELLPFTILIATCGLEFLWNLSAPPAPRAAVIGVAVTLLAIAVPYGAWAAVARGRLAVTALGLGVFAGAAIVTAPAVGRFPSSRVAAGVVLALMTAQLAWFTRDYFTDYRLRSSAWLGGNLRGALEELIAMDAHDHPPRIYFSILASTSGLMDIRNRWMSSYWDFYLIKHRRRDLLDRTAALDLARLADVPPGSLVLANIGETNTGALVRSGALTVARVIPEVQGEPFFQILKR